VMNDFILMQEEVCKSQRRVSEAQLELDLSVSAVGGSGGGFTGAEYGAAG